MDEEGEDVDDEEHEAAPESVAGSDAPAEATIASHRSWDTLLVFHNQTAEEEPEHDSSSQTTHERVGSKPNGRLGAGDADDRVARLESRIEGLESHMGELKEMLAELLAR